jgi:FMN phosphatase YigB (HAD superfamily)
MGKIKNILFDFGGVIITLDQPQAVRHFKEIGLADAEQRLLQAVGDIRRP